MNIIEIKKSIEDIVIEYNNLLGTESKNIEKEYCIENSSSLQKTIKQLENTYRLLKIGIIGRVKSGKSSLLNALLFNGEPVLPEAATPMTAALTEISYGDTLSAEIEFFSQEDIDDIESDYRLFLKKLNDLIKTKLEEMKNKTRFKGLSDQKLKDKANDQAKNELYKKYASLSAAYEQYEIIKNSDININSLKNLKKLGADNISELNKELLEYVGVNGKYMPFTKCAHIKFPLEILRDIKIVDTPGINDPVQSREECTLKLLKECDVTFVVSPSGQFLGKEDVELMDRISTKEGINEIYLVAAQVDTQLFGSEKQENNGDLYKILESIKSKLGELMTSTLTELKKTNPEVGTTFDQLIKNGKERIIFTSGISQTIIYFFDQKEKMDDNAKKVWENLTSHYPDYFSEEDKPTSIAGLDLLCNISRVEGIIPKVKLDKDKILSDKKNKFFNNKHKLLIKYKNELINYANEQINRIKNSDEKQLEKQKKNLTSLQKNASLKINEIYQELIEKINIDMDEELKKYLKNHFKEARSEIKELKDIDSVEYEVDKPGFGAKFQRWITRGKKGKETKYRDVTTIRTGAVRNALEELICDIEDSISIFVKSFIAQWKQKIFLDLIGTLRKTVDEEMLDTDLLKSTIRTVINSVHYPEIDDYTNLPKALKVKGTLKGEDAEYFLEDVSSFITKLKKKLKRSIDDYIEDLISTLNKIDPSEKIFENLIQRIEELDKQLKDKVNTLTGFNNFINKMEAIKNEE